MTRQNTDRIILLMVYILRHKPHFQTLEGFSNIFSKRSKYTSLLYQQTNDFFFETFPWISLGPRSTGEEKRGRVSGVSNTIDSRGETPNRAFTIIIVDVGMHSARETSDRSSQGEFTTQSQHHIIL